MICSEVSSTPLPSSAVRARRGPSNLQLAAIPLLVPSRKTTKTPHFGDVSLDSFVESVGGEKFALTYSLLVRLASCGLYKVATLPNIAFCPQFGNLGYTV